MTKEWAVEIKRRMTEQAKAEAEDCQLCVRASDVGVYVAGDPVVYPNQGCPVHEPKDPKEHP